MWTLLLLSLCAAPQGEEPPLDAPYDPAPDAQPFGGEAEILGGVLVKDLRTLFAADSRHRALLEQTRIGRAFAAAEAEGGGSLVSQLKSFVDVLEPEGAVPAQVVVFSQGYSVQVQLAFKTTSGALARLKAPAAPEGPARSWKVVSEGGADAVHLGEVRLATHVDEQGWLRLAATPAWAALPLVAQPFVGDVGRWTDDCYLVFFVDPQARIVRDLIGNAANPSVGRGLQEVRALALGLRDDGGKSTQLRLVMDAPPLMLVGPMLRGPQGVAATVPSWPGDVFTVVSLALPPMVVGGVLGEVERQLANTPQAPPRALLDALHRFSGRVELVAFGAPGDWALSLSFADEASAKAVVPALEPYLAGTLGAVSPSLAPLAHRETPEVMVLRPDPELEGPRVFALGTQVVIARQRARADALRAALAQPKEGLRIEGPLTDLVRSTAERPGLLNVYSVFGDDGGWADYFAWLAAGAQGALDKLVAESPQLAELTSSPLLKPLTHRLALTAALGGVASLLTYDLAAFADVEGTVLVIELSSSEI